MRDAVQIATEIASTLQIAQNAICGELFQLYSAGSLPRATDVVNYRGRAFAIVRSTLADAAERITASANSLAAEATLRARRDTHSDTTSVAVTVQSATVIKMLSSLLSQYVIDGEVLLRQYLSRTLLLRRAGLSNIKSLAMAKQIVDKQLQRWAKGKTRFSSFALSHALLLTIASHLTSLNHLTYIQEAVKHAAKQFRLVQPGHRRDGLVFDVEHIPLDELHPQSRAYVVVEV